jgi:ankyrin repeat protein
VSCLTVELSEPFCFLCCEFACGVTFFSSRGHTNVVHELLALGVDANYVPLVPYHRTTALHLAAAGGFADVVRALLRGGCNVNARTKTGETPLFSAASSGHHAVVADLLKAHAAPDTPRFDGITPLVVASSSGHVECVRELLLAGACCNLVHLPVVQLPLYLASRHGHLDIVRLLLDNGARADCFGLSSSAMHVAAMRGHVHICVALIDAGAPVDFILPKSGFTPLHLAADRGHSHVVRALLSKGANVNAAVSTSSITPLILACLRNHVAVARVLVSAGGDPMMTARRPDGLTAMQIALASGNEELCGALMAATGTRLSLAAVPNSCWWPVPDSPVRSFPALG